MSGMHTASTCMTHCMHTTRDCVMPTKALLTVTLHAKTHCAVVAMSKTSGKLSRKTRIEFYAWHRLLRKRIVTLKQNPHAVNQFGMAGPWRCEFYCLGKCTSHSCLPLLQGGAIQKHQHAYAHIALMLLSKLLVLRTALNTYKPTAEPTAKFGYMIFCFCSLLNMRLASSVKVKLGGYAV